MADEAVAVAAGTDLVLDHAEACLARSRVLAAAGDVKGANAAHSDAEALYAAKEAAISLGRTVEPVVPAAPGADPKMTRLALQNRASESVDAVCLAMQANDLDGTIAAHRSSVYHDRRRLSFDAIESLAEFRIACERCSSITDMSNGARRPFEAIASY